MKMFHYLMFGAIFLVLFLVVLLAFIAYFHWLDVYSEATPEEQKKIRENLHKTLSKMQRKARAYGA